VRVQPQRLLPRRFPCAPILLVHHTAANHALQNDVADIKGILNNGLRTMVQDQKSELATVKDDIQLIRDALTSHVKDVLGVLRWAWR
jgi:hypothetical protein